MNSENTLFICIAAIIIVIALGMTMYNINQSNIDKDIALTAVKSGYVQKVVKIGMNNPIIIWVKDANNVGYSTVNSPAN
jgi:hypothetical protein